MLVLCKKEQAHASAAGPGYLEKTQRNRLLSVNLWRLKKGKTDGQ